VNKKSSAPADTTILHFAFITLYFFHSGCGMWKTFLWINQGKNNFTTPCGKVRNFPHLAVKKKALRL
jgi:hypothetical protein